MFLDSHTFWGFLFLIFGFFRILKFFKLFGIFENLHEPQICFLSLAFFGLFKIFERSNLTVPIFRTAVSIVLNVTMFGTAVVFLLLAAKNLETFLRAYTDLELGFCYLVLIVAVCMLPFTMLKSPKDFW